MKTQKGTRYERKSYFRIENLNQRNKQTNIYNSKCLKRYER